MANPERKIPGIQPALVGFLQLEEGQSLKLKRINTETAGMDSIVLEVRKIDDSSKDTLDTTIVSLPILDATREWLLAQPEPDKSDEKELRRVIGIRLNFVKIDIHLPRPREELHSKPIF